MLLHSGGSRPDIWEGQANRGAPKSLNCLNTQGYRLQLSGITQKWLPLVGQDSVFFVD